MNAHKLFGGSFYNLPYGLWSENLVNGYIFPFQIKWSTECVSTKCADFVAFQLESDAMDYVVETNSLPKYTVFVMPP